MRKPLPLAAGGAAPLVWGKRGPQSSLVEKVRKVPGEAAVVLRQRKHRKQLAHSPWAL